MKQKNFFKIAIFFLFVATTNTTFGQYGGTGTFTKITDVSDIVDNAYYVLLDETSEGNAMNNSHNGSYLARTNVSPSMGTLTDPNASIVWEIKTDGSGKSIYNSVSAKYASYTGSSNKVQVVNSVTSDNQRWNITYNTDEFWINNVAVSARRLQYNTGDPRFACYKGTQKDIAIYKMPIVSTTTPTVSFDAAMSSENETDMDVVTAGIPVSFINHTANVTITPTVNAASTAEAGDYTIDLTPLTFTADQTLNIPLTIKDDADFNDETIIIDFTVTSGTADLGTSQHTVTIVDDETPPVPSLIITEVADPKDEYSGRFVEIYNNGASDIDLTSEQIHIVIQSNGGTINSRALSGTIAANTVMIIGNSTNINNNYGFAADENYVSITGNGDDGYYLFHGGDNTTGTLFDSYGLLGQDGTGKNWEYEDTRAYRNSPKTATPNATWTLSEWTVESTDKNLVDMTPGALENEFRYDGDWKPRDVGANATATDDIYISMDVTLTSNLTVNDFEVITGQFATITNGGSLIVNGTPTGNIKYTRTLLKDADVDKAWYTVSSPVTGESISDLITNNTFLSGTNDIALASYDNTQVNDDDKWAYYPNSGTITDNVTAGKGYTVKLDNAQANSLVSFTGTMNTGNVVQSIADGTASAFNLLGNPYTAYISSNLFLPANTGLLESETIWVWNQGTESYDTKVTADDFKVAPAQGFFVERTAMGTAANFTFDVGNQSHESTDTFQRSSRPEVQLFVSNGSTSKYAKIYYINGTTTGFDNGYDGTLFSGFSTDFAVYSQLVSSNVGDNYQIQSLPDANLEAMVIPIGVKAAAGNLTFTAEALNLPANYKVFLEDRTAGISTRLDEVGSKYEVTLTTAADGVGRFYLHTSQSVLSVNDLTLENVSIYKTDNATLRITGLSQEKATVKLYNILGKQVLSTSFETNGIQDVSLPKLALGVYIVQLKTTSGTLNKKIILE